MVIFSYLLISLVTSPQSSGLVSSVCPDLFHRQAWALILGTPFLCLSTFPLGSSFSLLASMILYIPGLSNAYLYSKPLS